jgi:hypothetical protein
VGSLPDPLESVRERLRVELREAFERATAVERPADAEGESDFQPTLGYAQGVIAGLSARARPHRRRDRTATTHRRRARSRPRLQLSPPLQPCAAREQCC